MVVPIYNTLSPAQIAYLLRHSGCRAAIIAGAGQWEILEPLLAELAEMKTIVGHGRDARRPQFLAADRRRGARF